MKTMFKRTLMMVLAMICLASHGQTTVQFYLTQFTGSTNDTTINVQSQNNPVIYNGQFYWQPAHGTNVMTTNGFASLTLIPGKYNVSFAGIPQSWTITVTNSATALNAVGLQMGTVIYNGINSLTGNGVSNDGHGNYTVSLIYSGVASNAIYATNAGFATVAATASLATNAQVAQLSGGVTGVISLTNLPAVVLTNNQPNATLATALTVTNPIAAPFLYLNGPGWASSILGGNGLFSFSQSASFNGNVQANGFYGSGGNLTGLNGSQVTSGTVPIAQLPVATASTLGIGRGDGTTITSFNGIFSSVGGNTTSTNAIALTNGVGTGTLLVASPAITTTNLSVVGAASFQAGVTNQSSSAPLQSPYAQFNSISPISANLSINAGGGNVSAGSFTGGGSGLTGVNASTAVTAISATQAAAATIATNVVSGISVTNPTEISGTYTGGTYGGNGFPLTNLNGAAFSTPVQAVDLSGPIAINANATPMTPGWGAGYAPPNTNIAGGELQLLGVAFGSGDANPAITTNGSLITADTSGGFPAYLGIQFAAPVVITRFRGAPDPTVPGGSIADEMFMEAVGYGTCTSTGFAGKVPYGATPFNPVQPTMYWWNRYQYTEITNGFPTASTSFAYLAFTNSYLAIAQQMWFGYGTTYAAPVAPMISPCGGHYPPGYPYYGSTTVTLTSISTAASIYYTLDGSTPTGPAHGTLYTGPFTLNCASANTVTNPIVLKAMAYQSGLYQPASTLTSVAYFYSTGYVPQDTYYDQNGNKVELHTPAIMNDFINGHGFIVYGNNWNVAMNGLSGAGLNTMVGIGFNAYSTPDMLNFTYLGQVFGVPNSALNANQESGGYAYRFHPFFNPVNHQYVGWNFLGGGTTQFADGVLTNSSPTGTWGYLYTNCTPFGTTAYGDLTTLTTTSGNFYLIQNSNPPVGGVWITQLSSSGTTNVGSATLICPAYSEAPTVIQTSWGFIATLQVKGNYNNATLPMFETNYVCFGSNPLATWYQSTALFPTEPVYSGTFPTNLYNGQTGCSFQSIWNTNQTMQILDHMYNGSTTWWNPMLNAYSTNVTINPADGTNAVLDSSTLVFVQTSNSYTNLTAITNANWNLSEWNKPQAMLGPISLSAITPLGTGGDLWNSNGVLYFINTMTGHTNYVTGP